MDWTSKNSRKKSAAAISFLLILTLMATPACRKGPSLIDHAAPDFRLDLIEGGADWSLFLRRKPPILYFFASW